MKMSSIVQKPATLLTAAGTAKTTKSFASLRSLSRLMMGLFVLLGLLGLNQQAKAQATTLAAGDIAVVGMNSANPDRFAVVLLKDINTGTVINFTDNGFTGTNTTGRTGEGFLTYTAPSAQTAGTVLTWTNGMTIAGTGWSSNNPTNFAINASGDQLFAFQGSTANWSSQTGITLLFGMNYGVALSATSGASNTLQPSTTILPATSFLNLPSTTNANGYFANGSTGVTSVTVSGSPASLLALFVDATKWVGTSSTAATFPTFNITVNTATPTITTTGTLADVSTTYGIPSATPTSFTVSGANMNAGILVTPPAGYEVSQTAGGASGYAATQTVGASGTIAATTIFVRLLATASVAGSPYSGDIVCSSSGAASQNVATVSSTVSPAALTITANDQNKVYNTVLSLGTSAFTATGLQNGETIGAVTLTDGGEAANATANVGTYPITPSAATGGTFTASNYTISYVAGTLTITKANQTITFNTLANKLSTDADFNLTATASSGLAVTYTGNNNAVATVTSAGLVDLLAVGTVDFTASQAGDANYNPATDVTRTQVVLNGNLITPVITFNALATVTYGDAAFSLGATSTSPVAITYTSFDPTVASISGSTVNILKNGTTVITASQVGDGVTYNAAVDVPQTLTVNQKALTVTGTIANNKVYDGTTAAIIDITAATLNGVVGADQVILNGTSGTFATANVGTAIVVTPAFTLSGTEAGRYTLTLPALTADITKATQTITGLPATDTRTYALTPLTYQLAATASSGLAVTYTSSDPLVATVTTNGFVTITGAGTANITASQAGDGNYEAATDAVQVLTVNKANQFITFSTPAPKVTTDADFQLTATASSALAVTYTSSNPAVATVTSTGLVDIIGAGTTSITVSQAGDGNFNPATDVVRTLLVTKPIVAHWTFEAVSLSTPGATLNISAGSAVADAGLQTAGSSFTGAHASAATIWTTGAGNGSTKGVGSDRWAVGDYWQFSASTAGYQDISLVWDQIGSNTGPGNFKVQYSTDGANFIDFNTYATPNNAGAALSWSSTTPISTSTLNFDLSSITALNNAATVYFRIVNNNTTAVNGGTVATAGTGRLDNFKITAQPLVVTPPVITSSLTATATVGTPFSYQIVATGATSYSSTTSLPLNGFDLNTTTGEITGTPTAAGTTTINLTATNAGGSDSKDLVITVNNGCNTTGVAVPTAVTCFGSNNGSALITLSGAGFGTSGTYTVDGTPAGTYTTNPFTVTGLTAGSHTVVTTNGTCVSAPITFTIGSPMALVLNASVTQITVPGGTGAVTLTAAGGTAPYTFAPGNPATNNLVAGSYTYNVTDANGCTASRTVSIYLEVITVTPFVLDATAYRGAFAPAPTRQWTESWTNFDPQNTTYGTPNVMVNVADSIVSNTTWTSNNVYQLNGLIYVSNNATLTIEPGTVIRGNEGNSSLIVTRGAKIKAEGTQCNPIVFTSNQAPGARTPGAWGGVILLGKAKNNLGTNSIIDGLDNADARNYHGGNDDEDNSGILKYVRIEYSGYVLSANNEINGLTMGSVGNGTTLDYVQVSHGDDDAFEWFGGSVNAKHLIAYKTKDDDFDTDNGYSGTVQYALGIKDPNISDVSQSEGFESDNSATGIAGQLPKTSAKFYNVTQIGAFRCASNADASGVAPTALFQHRRGARVRRNSDLKIINSILMNNWRGLYIDDAIVAGQLTQPTSANYNEDSALFRNNIIAGDFTTIWTGTNYNGTQSLAYEDAVTRAIGTSALYGNDSVNTCSLLIDPWNANPALADFRPNIGGAGALVTDAANLSTGADITPTVDIDNALFTPNQAYDFVINIYENGGGATNGEITVSVPMPSGWTISVPSTASGTSDVFGGTPNENSNWNFVVVANTSVTITSKAGTIIGKSGQAVIGLRATRKATTSTGTSQSLSLTVNGGGDATPINNSNVTGFGTSN
jgi:YDG domain/MBG domain (YGX type)/Bacterial Ig-like domain (group 2)